MINKDMPIYFDEEKKGIFSTITKKTYFNEETGIINKIKNPFNENKQILLLAGLRNPGTKASIIAFLKHFSEVKKSNPYKSEIYCRIVEGLDMDSDGNIDDCEFME